MKFTEYTTDGRTHLLQAQQMLKDALESWDESDLQNDKSEAYNEIIDCGESVSDAIVHLTRVQDSILRLCRSETEWLK